MRHVTILFFIFAGIRGAKPGVHADTLLGKDQNGAAVERIRAYAGPDSADLYVYASSEGKALILKSF